MLSALLDRLPKWGRIDRSDDTRPHTSPSPHYGHHHRTTVTITASTTCPLHSSTTCPNTAAPQLPALPEHHTPGIRGNTGGRIGRSPAPRHNGLHPAGRDLGDNAVLTIRRLSMGSGFKYLMDSIAVGDGKPDQTSNLTRYYAESGTPPGVFLGAGLADLDGGNGIEIGSQVSEEQLQNMLGLIVDPVSGEPLGTAPKRKPASVATRIEDRVSRLPAALGDEERAAEVARIEAEEQSRQCKQAAPVAGFDLTFSPSKSVSVAWALADQGTKAVIYECHRRAIEYTLAYARAQRLPLPIGEGRCRPRGRVRGGCCSVHPLRQSLG